MCDDSTCINLMSTPTVLTTDHSQTLDTPTFLPVSSSTPNEKPKACRQLSLNVTKPCDNDSQSSVE